MTFKRLEMYHVVWAQPNRSASVPQVTGATHDNPDLGYSVYVNSGTVTWDD